MVIAHAPISNFLAEQMFGTIKKSFCKMIAREGEDWVQTFSEEDVTRLYDVLFGYRLHFLADGVSPFDLLYSSKPRISSSGCFMFSVPATTEYR